VPSYGEASGAAPPGDKFQWAAKWAAKWMLEMTRFYFLRSARFKLLR